VALKSPFIVSSPSMKLPNKGFKQEWMLKLKPWKDTEGIIFDFEPLLHNNNEQYENEQGYMVRSKHQDNMEELPAVGAFWVKWNGKDVKVGCGKGITMELRYKWWAIREQLKGEKLNFKYLNLSSYGIPRHPTARGPRFDA